MIMKRKTQLALGIFMLIGIMGYSLINTQDPIKYPELQKEIFGMADADQKYRRKYVTLLKKGKEKTSKFDKVAQTLVAIDRKNTARMKEIIKQYGWPTITAVGKRASNSAWLLVQHADRDPIFQKYCLTILETEMEKNQIDPANYAFLYDRVQLARGEKQKYATQSTRDEYTKKTFFQAIEDETNVQRRRTEMRIDIHVEEYAKRLGFAYKVPSLEEANRRTEEFAKAYEDNIEKAKVAYDKKEFKIAADHYLRAAYSDGNMSTSDYVALATSISQGNYDEKAYWGCNALVKASLRGWDGIFDLELNPDFENLKKAGAGSWEDLMKVVQQLK
ncbi:hypothetical protein N9954_06705 [Maribacter sp.]|nr:hypothetical protein [Maribacter sp.]